MTNSAFTHEPTITVPSTTQTGALVRWGDTSGGSFTAFANSTTGITSDGTHLTMLRQGLLKFEGASAVSVNLGVSGTVDSSGYNINLPLAAPGGNDKMLQSNNSGQLVWIDTPSGGAVSALSGNAENRIPTFGSTTTVLDGSANLTFNGATLVVTHTSSGNAIEVKSTGADSNAQSRITNDARSWDFSVRGDASDSLFITDVGAGDLSGKENRIKISTSGQVTKPAQSCGLVRVVSDINNQTGNESSSAYQVPFSSAQTSCFDQNGDWSNSANTFYAPVTGRYLWNVKISFKDNLSTASTDIWVALTSDHDSGSTYTIWHWPGRPDGIGTGNSFTVGGSIVVELDAGEYINCKVRVNGEGANDVQIEGGGSFASYLSWCLLA